MEAIIPELLANGATQGVTLAVVGWFAWNRQKRCDDLTDELAKAYRETSPLLDRAIRLMQTLEG